MSFAKDIRPHLETYFNSITLKKKSRIWKVILYISPHRIWMIIQKLLSFPNWYSKTIPWIWSLKPQQIGQYLLVIILNICNLKLNSSFYISTCVLSSLVSIFRYTFPQFISIYHDCFQVSDVSLSMSYYGILEYIYYVVHVNVTVITLPHLQPSSHVTWRWIGRLIDWRLATLNAARSCSS